MPIEVDGEKYYTIAEAAKYLRISRETFYQNVRDELQSYRFGALKRTYYRESDLIKFNGPKPTHSGK